MKSFTMRLDPSTREELYADIHTDVLDFVLMEALNLSGKEILENPETMVEALGDDEFHLNDPFIDMDESIRAILDYLREIDKANDVDVMAPGYSVEGYYQTISDKLVLAMASITAANPALDLVNFYQQMHDPLFHGGMEIRGSHLGNIVVMSLSVVIRGLPNAL